MKVTTCWLVAIGLCAAVGAQGQVLNNGHIVLDSGSVLVIRNTGLINNGQFLQSAGKVRFTGDDSGFVSGTGAVRFFDLEIAKGDAGKVQLQRAISIGRSVIFTGGYLHLGSYQLLLSDTARLSGERETSRLTADQGGFAEITTPLNAPVSSNPGNLGAILTATGNPGTVTIRRGHLPQSITAINKKGINRYYHLLTSATGEFSGTLRLQYFNAETNDNAENKLVLYRSADSLSWTAVGQTTRNDNDNFVEMTAINPFSRFTLAEAAAPTGVFDPPGAGTAVKLWPNPTQGALQLSIAVASAAKASLLIYDMAGKPVYHRDIHLLYGSNQFALDVQTLSPGQYTLKLLAKDGSSVDCKFIRLPR